MAADADTFTFMFNMLKVYSMQGGSVFGAYVDGTYNNGHVTSQSGSDWLCVNTQGSCPSTMPWHRGQPDDPQSQQCAGIFHAFNYNEGVGDAYCESKIMVMCRI